MALEGPKMGALGCSLVSLVLNPAVHVDLSAMINDLLFCVNKEKQILTQHISLVLRYASLPLFS